jgi:AraC-like DNA-binding protein
MGSLRTGKLAFEKRHYEREWYPTARSPRFYMEPFTVRNGAKCVAEIFSGVEVDVLRSGHGWFYLDGRRHEMHPGDIAFYDCMIPHGFSPAAGEEMVLLGAHMQLDAVIAANPVRGDMRLYEPFVALRSGLEPVVRGESFYAGVLEEAYRVYHSRCMDWDILAWSSLQSVLVSIRGRLSDMVAERRNPYWLDENGLVGNALEFINDHCCEPITLEQIARACACSVSSLSHVFSQVMDISPIDYRNRLRVIRAVERIAQTTEGLNQIALSVGFSSHSQFYDLFKRLTGRTPASLRKA